jgi:two-component system, LuxR family, sensor kinase FixL
MLVGCIAFLDYWTDPQLSFSVFYLMPISLVTWYGNRRGGMFISVLAVAALLVVELKTQPRGLDSAAPYWNAAAQFSIFLVVVFLLGSIRKFNKELEGMVGSRTVRLREETDGHTRGARTAHEREELFRQIAETIREVFWVTNSGKDQMIYISPGYETIWGRTCQSLYDSPRTWLDAVHSTDRERIEEAVSTRQLEGSYDEIYRIVRPDGGIRWIQDRAFPVRDESGAVCQIIGIAEDVSVRKRAEQKNAILASLSHRLSAAANPLEAARIILDSASELLGWDSAYVDLYSPVEDRIIPVLTIDTINGRRTEVSSTTFSLDQSPLMRLVMRVGGRLINRSDAPSVPMQLVPFGDTGRRSGSLMFSRIHSAERVMGVLSIQSYTPDAYASEDLMLLEALADHCGDTLRRIEIAETLRESEAQFRALFESAPIGMAMHRAKGNIVQANRGYRDMLGYTGDEILTVGTSQLTHPDDRAAEEWHHRELMDGKCDQSSWEQRFQHKDGRPVWAKCRACAVRDVGGGLRFIISMVEDVTDRHAAEERIRQLASIVDSAHDAIIGTNLEGIIVNWNRAAERLYGYTQDEILGQPVRLLAGPEHTGEPVPVLEQNVNESGIETLHRGKDGNQINVSLAISPVLGDAGQACGFSVIARDMTERRRLERQVLEISAAERRSIGHELHDGVGQHLAGTAFKAKLLQEMLRDTAPRLAAQAGEVVGLINAGIDQVRRLAHGLDPIEAEAAGLEPALNQLADDTRTVYRIQCEFHCNQTVPSPEPVISLQLFRIAQEAVHNALEHGHAKSIQIALTSSDSMTCLDITDDGSGFSYASQSLAGGLGLRIMKYRARTIGGFLLVESKMNGGTRITCQIPALRETGCKLEALRPFVPPLQHDNPCCPPQQMVKS